jgi:hypothetical protein
MKLQYLGVGLSGLWAAEMLSAMWNDIVVLG